MTDQPVATFLLIPEEEYNSPMPNKAKQKTIRKRTIVEAF